MQLNLNFLSKKSKKVYFFKDIFGKFKPGFVAQRKWWNGGNPPYGKLIKVGTGLQHLSFSRMTCGNNAQCSKSKAQRKNIKRVRANTDL